MKDSQNEKATINGFIQPIFSSPTGNQASFVLFHPANPIPHPKPPLLFCSPSLPLCILTPYDILMIVYHIYFNFKNAEQ